MGKIVYCIRLKLKPVPLSKAMVHYENEKVENDFKAFCQKLLSDANGNDFWFIMYFNKYVYWMSKWAIKAALFLFTITGLIVLIKLVFFKFSFATMLVIPKTGFVSLNLFTLRMNLDRMSPPIKISEENLDDVFQKFISIPG